MNTKNKLTLKDFQSDIDRCVVRYSFKEDRAQPLTRIVEQYYMHIKDECVKLLANEYDLQIDPR